MYAYDLSNQMLTNKELAILHWTFHPNDIPRKLIRCLYDTTPTARSLRTRSPNPNPEVYYFIIAYHGAPTIRSAVTKAKLIQEPGKEASKYFDGELDPD